MSNGITVIKRNGDKDSLNLEKVHKMVEHACEGLAGVSASQVEISSGIQFFDGIKTSQIPVSYTHLTLPTTGIV